MTQPDLSEAELQEMLARVQSSQPTTKLLAVWTQFPEMRIGKPPPFPNPDGSKISQSISGINIIAQNPQGTNGEVMPTYQVQVFIKGQTDPRIFLIPQMVCIPEMMLQRLVVPNETLPENLVLVK